MKLWLLRWQEKLLNSFWFLPLLLAAVAGAGAFLSVHWDSQLGSDWVHKTFGWVWSGGVEGARSVLSVIAGSLMTVVSIVFSLTISTLAQVSSHFGPRVLRQFTSDRIVQFTLGTFIATFVYCLLVLRSIRSVEESTFVPYISVNIGMVLALGSLAILIYYIHHISRIIQAEPLIADVGQDIQNAMASLFPESIGDPVNECTDTSLRPPDERQWQGARHAKAVDHGYLQAVDESRLMELATQYDVILRLPKRPGDFVMAGSVLASILPSDRVSDDAIKELQSCFNLGSQRTPDQDVLYLMQQLVEIGAHALSPGINEPFTALLCIDWLGAALRTGASREWPVPLRQDQEGKLRLVTRTLNFEEMTHAIFDQIRMYGASTPDVLLKLLGVIADVTPMLRREQDRQVLIAYVQIIGEDGEREIANGADRARVINQVHETLRILEER